MKSGFFKDNTLSIVQTYLKFNLTNDHTVTAHADDMADWLLTGEDVMRVRFDQEGKKICS